MSAASQGEQATTAQQGRGRWLTLGVVCIATMMLLLDVTVVNVALPNISESLGATFSDLQWVIDAYALGLAALLLTWGGVADQIGRRKVFVIGLAVFSTASLLCALATTPLLLNLARLLQGLGGAAMFATALAILASTFEGAERGTAIGIWGATIGAAVAVGPLVGGVLIQIASWHWIFLVNVPIGVAAIALALRFIPESRNPQGQGIDVPGAVTFSGALFLLIFGLVRGNAEGWGSPLIVGSLVAAAVLLALFVALQRRSGPSMLDLALFRNPAFVGVSLAAFSLSAAMFSLFLYLTLWIQNGLGYSALEAGIRFLPLTLLSFFVAPISGRLSAKVPPGRLIGAGLTLVGVGILLMRGLGAGSGWTALLPGFVCAGIGIGLTNPPLASTAVSVVDVRRAGMAAGINNTFRQVGIATGTAALGAAMAGLLTTRVDDAVRQIAGPQAVAALPPGDVLTQAPPALIDRLPGGSEMFLGAYTSALDVIFLAAGLLALVSAVACFALLRTGTVRAGEGEPAAAPAG